MWLGNFKQWEVGRVCRARGMTEPKAGRVGRHQTGEELKWPVDGVLPIRARGVIDSSHVEGRNKKSRALEIALWWCDGGQGQQPREDRMGSWTTMWEWESGKKLNFFKSEVNRLESQLAGTNKAVEASSTQRKPGVLNVPRDVLVWCTPCLFPFGVFANISGLGDEHFQLFLKNKIWQLWTHVPAEHPLDRAEKQLPLWVGTSSQVATFPTWLAFFPHNTYLHLVGTWLWGSHSDVSGIENREDYKT